MNILIIHNFHRPGAPSGDDVVVKQELELLKEHGHNVFLLSKENKDFENFSIFRKLKTFWELDYSRDSYEEVLNFLRSKKIDVVHIHNIFPLWTPAVYFACKDAGVPVVHTLHDFRFFCANAFLFRSGEICDLCFKKSSHYAIYYRCFKGSLAGSFFVSRYLKKVKSRKIYQMADKYIALTEFAKKKYLDFGIPERKIAIKPNFIPFTDFNPNFSSKESYFSYVGRISEEKGILTLIEALRYLEGRGLQVKIAGAGPLEKELTSSISGVKGIDVEFLGFLPREKVFEIIAKSRALIFPSICSESFPTSILEAFSAGTPVIASNFGAMSHVISDHRTGLLFEKGNPYDLAEKILYLANNPDKAIEMGKNARKEYLEKYTPEVNYNTLMKIYEEVIRENSSK
ncbi:MAG: glycosyltransferase family 4 protein [Candidatus Hydrothermia bacterium]